MAGNFHSKDGKFAAKESFNQYWEYNFAALEKKFYSMAANISTLEKMFSAMEKNISTKEKNILNKEWKFHSIIEIS